MSKINITEQDLSWFIRQREQGVATVYIPGIATFGPTDVPVLCDSSNFTKVYGTSPVYASGGVDISYDMAASFIKAGFNVLFHRISLPGSLAASAQLKNSDTNIIKFSAKYLGTFGDRISLRLTSAAGVQTKFASKLIVQVLVDGVNVENLLYDFTDLSSQNYYESVESDYIQVTVSGDPSKIVITPDTGVSYQTVKLANGKDYTTDQTFSSIKSAVATTLATATTLSGLEDPYQFDFDVIVSGGWSLYSEDTSWSKVDKDKVDKVLFNLAASRGTSIYLVDGEAKWTDAEMYNYCGLFDSSYAAAYGPWSYAQLLSTGVTRKLPGSYSMIVQWAQTCANGTPIWMAPAGVKRASLGSFFKETAYVVGKTTLDMWQNHDYNLPGQYCVNPIMKVKQYGYTIYGNSTLLKTRLDGATSALQSFSARVLTNIIKLKAFDIALSLQFDQLTGDLFIQYKTLLGTFMDQLKYQNALYDYEIIPTEGNPLTAANLNERTIPVTIRISPILAAENFDITLEVTQSGVTFSDESETV